MFRLLRSITLNQCFTEQLPALVGAALAAEVFYKFHSFVLETGAFLATWLVLDMLLQGAAKMIGALSRSAGGPASPLAIQPCAQDPVLFLGSSSGGASLSTDVTRVAVNRQKTAP